VNLIDENEKLKPLPMGVQMSVVFIPKCWRRTLYKALCNHLDEVFQRLWQAKKKVGL